MGTVQDKERQAGQESVPGSIALRKNGVVQHIRVGENDVRSLAHSGASLGRRVAVVGVDLDPIQGGRSCHQAAETSQLVLGQRLGGENHQCAPTLARKVIENYKLVNQRFPAKHAA